MVVFRPFCTNLKMFSANLCCCCLHTIPHLKSCLISPCQLWQAQVSWLSISYLLYCAYCNSLLLSELIISFLLTQGCRQKNKNSIFKVIAQIGGRQVNPISKEKKRNEFLTKVGEGVGHKTYCQKQKHYILYDLLLNLVKPRDSLSICLYP